MFITLYTEDETFEFGYDSQTGPGDFTNEILTEMYNNSTTKKFKLSVVSNTGASLHGNFMVSGLITDGTFMAQIAQLNFYGDEYYNASEVYNDLKWYKDIWIFGGTGIKGVSGGHMTIDLTDDIGVVKAEDYVGHPMLEIDIIEGKDPNSPSLDTGLKLIGKQKDIKSSLLTLNQ